LGTLIGRPPSRPSTTFLAHPNRVSHMRRSAAHWRAIHARTATRPWTGAPYSGVCPPPTAPHSKRPPATGSGNVAATQRRTADRRHRGRTAPSHHLPALPHPFVSTTRQPSRPCERRDDDDDHHPPD
jgi:hypothetical protein